MNAFLTIWTKPGETIREMVDKKSIGFGILVMIIAALSTSVLSGADSGVDEFLPFSMILLLTAVISIVFSIIGYFFNGGVYLLLGKMLGGKGRYKEVCLAAASASLPSLVLLPFSILAVVLYHDVLYSAPVDPFAVTSMPIAFFTIYTAIMVAVSIYGVVILSKALGYAHQFSAWRGFGVVAIYGVIAFIIGIFIAIVLVFGGLMLMGL